MDITRFNQLVALPDFAREVEKCEFFAIDQEMTGVDVPGIPTQFGAPPEAVYHAKRIAVETYNAFQIGIALFRKTENNVYEVRPYNFYLLNDSGDLRLALPAVSFLAANRMNFQMWLTAGLPFCNAQEELDYEKQITTLFTDEVEQEISNDLVKAIDEWIPTASAPLVKELSCSLNLAQRLQAFLSHRYDSRIVINYDGKPYLAQKIKFTLTKLSKAEWISEKEKRRLRCERDRARQLGFRQFWKILLKSRKPIVGHNFMQDIMFMIHMHETPLPVDYLEFKKLLQHTLPTIYDTKTMATKLMGDNAFQVTHLESLYQECRRRAGLSTDEFTLQYRLPPGFYNYNDYAGKQQSKAHEAAYDAYMTGITFLLLHKLYPDAFSEVKNVISAFGSAYLFCIDEDDQVANNNTFILKCTVPCYTEEIEALFFASEDMTAQAASNEKVDIRKLSYQVSSVAASDRSKRCTTFCVRMKQSVGVNDLNSRLQSLRDKELSDSTNLNRLLLDCITLQKL
ncbi:poly(A)-specific ribonuclease PARN, putative [Leishmania guyanensis]|uniref:Uncharacterized protein n=1 Tax=Leishmania guyanensis TaxID=5670 RepID=A0A1E1J8F6_LEIGU|nr:hypothetical protein, conserved [Leishmania guyanensis]